MSKETVYASPDGDVHLYKRLGPSLPKDGRLELEIGGWTILEENVDPGHPLYGPLTPERGEFIEWMYQLIGQLESAVEILDPGSRTAYQYDNPPCNLSRSDNE